MTSRALPLVLLVVAACNADPARVKVQASVLLRDDSPWPGTLQLTGGFTRSLSVASNDIACVAIDSIPRDTVRATATIMIPSTPRVLSFSWSFAAEPYLSVQLSGDSAGGVNVSRVGFSNDAGPCIP